MEAGDGAWSPQLPEAVETGGRAEGQGSCRPPSAWGSSKRWTWGTSLAVQWLRLHASTAGATSSIHGWGTKISHALCAVQPETKQHGGLVHLNRRGKEDSRMELAEERKGIKEYPQERLPGSKDTAPQGSVDNDACKLGREGGTEKWGF